MLNKALLFVALMFVFNVYAASRPVPLIDPAPIAIPAGASAATIEKTIIEAGLRHGWEMVDRKPGIVSLRYAARGFWVTISVMYDDRNVTIKYAGSDNLQYGMESTLPVSKDIPSTHPLYKRMAQDQVQEGDKGGIPVIHPNYNRWVNTLSRDMVYALKLSLIK